MFDDRKVDRSVKSSTSCMYRPTIKHPRRKKKEERRKKKEERRKKKVMSDVMGVMGVMETESSYVLCLMSYVSTTLMEEKALTLMCNILSINHHRSCHFLKKKKMPHYTLSCPLKTYLKSELDLATSFLLITENNLNE